MLASRAPRVRRLAALAAILALAGCKSSARSGPSAGAPAPSASGAAGVAAAVLRVPHIAVPLKLDGELDELVWRNAARTGVFLDTAGADARPYSDARFLWDDKNLYVALYAADDDIETTVTEHDGPVWIDDAFSIRLTPVGDRQPTYAIDISAAGVTTDVRQDASGAKDARWESGITLGIDKDGTPNDPRDEDEEWVVESAIPLAPLALAPTPGTRVGITIARCDIPRNSKQRRCGAFGEGNKIVQLELAAP